MKTKVIETVEVMASFYYLIDFTILHHSNVLTMFFLFSAMECLVRILLWSSLVTTWTSNHFTLAQSHFPTKFSKKEVFFVNLEEGYFGCQVNETLEVLQIFKIEKLCDGTSDCYLGSDENQKELKCSSKYRFRFTVVTDSFHKDSIFTLKPLSMYFKFLVSIKFHA